MIAALDVHYDEGHARGTSAAVLFDDWQSAVPTAEHTAIVEGIQPYVPGQFFRRELPCILAVLAKIELPIHTLIVDSYVQLGDRPGLGQILWEHLGGQTPVIGVAKTLFQGAAAVEVTRGDSHQPLFVTAVGIEPAEAAAHVRQMHGPFRIPTLLKRADQLARGR